MDDLNMSVGVAFDVPGLAGGIKQRIVECRREAGLTQEDLAKKLTEWYKKNDSGDAVNVSTVRNWESSNGKRLPTAVDLVGLSAIFNVYTDWLLTGTGA